MIKIIKVKDFIKEFKKIPEAEILITVHKGGGSMTFGAGSLSAIKLIGSNKPYIEMEFVEYVPKKDDEDRPRRRDPS